MKRKKVMRKKYYQERVKKICKGEREEEKHVEKERKKYNLIKKESTSKEKRKKKRHPTKESTLAPLPLPQSVHLAYLSLTLPLPVWQVHVCLV